MVTSTEIKALSGQHRDPGKKGIVYPDMHFLVAEK